MIWETFKQVFVNRRFRRIIMFLILFDIGAMLWAGWATCILQPRLPVTQNDIEHVIIDDYQTWLLNNSDDVIEHLPNGVSEERWNDVVIKSFGSEYRRVPCCVRTTPTYNDPSTTSTTIAWADPVRNRVIIGVDTPFWKNIVSQYEPLENGEPSTDNLTRLAQGAAFRILCHENAHLALIPSHADVYAVGDACQYAVMNYYGTDEDS